MLIRCEKILVHKGYLPTNEKNKIISFYKKGEPFKQFNIERINDKYKVSFPIDNKQYSTTIVEKNEMTKYVQYILHEI